MPETTLLQHGPLTVVDYRCQSARREPAYAEWHDVASVSFVRRGTFGYRCRGRAHELVAGAVLVGRAGDEFVCTHDHHGGGDECLSFRLSPELLSCLGERREAWSRSVLPPLAELMVLGELAQAAAEGRSDLGLDEAGLWFVSRCLDLAAGVEPEPVILSPALRRRTLESALWLEANANEPIDLGRAAAHAGTSSYHFLRLFSRVVGASPHQYLVRCRLRRAARLLNDGASVTGVALAVGFGDLSNFIRTFRRAAGVTPLEFQARARAGRRRGHALTVPPRPSALR
jgi:AraC family transcriptional regulator